MKKLCLILALIMALGVLAGCSSGPDKDGYYHAGAAFEYDGFKVKVGKYEIVDDKVTVPIEITNKRTDSYGNTNFATWRSGFNDEIDSTFFGIFDLVYYSESIPGGDTVKMVASMSYHGAGEYKIYCTKTGVVEGENLRDPDEKIIVFNVKEESNIGVAYEGSTDAASEKDTNVPDENGYYHSGATIEYDGFIVKIGEYEIVDDNVTVPFEVTNKRTDSYTNVNFATWRSGFNDKINSTYWGIFDFEYYSESIPGGDTIKMVASIPYQGEGKYKIYCTKTGVVEGEYFRDPDEKIIVFDIKEGFNVGSISAEDISTPDENGYYHFGDTIEYDGFLVKIGEYRFSDYSIKVPFEIMNKHNDSYSSKCFQTWRRGFNDEVENTAWGIFDSMYYSESIPSGGTIEMVATIQYQGEGEYKIYCTKTGDVENYKDPNEKIIVFRIG